MFVFAATTLALAATFPAAGAPLAAGTGGRPILKRRKILLKREVTIGHGFEDQRMLQINGFLPGEGVERRPLTNLIIPSKYSCLLRVGVIFLLDRSWLLNLLLSALRPDW